MNVETPVSGDAVSGVSARWLPLFRTESWRRLGLFIFAVCYGVFFFRMTRTGFRSWFSEDDVLNTYYCWSRPTIDLLRANVLFVNGYYRPFTELVYCGGYALFGFNPVPFNVFRFLLGVANLFVLYTFVRRISCSREAGVLAVMLGGVHPATQKLFVDSGMLYDALAFFFYFSAFSWYLKCRQAGDFPPIRQLLVLSLSLLALNSKEIAVSFPVALLLYELTIGPAADPIARQLPTLLRRFQVTLLGAFTLDLAIRSTGAPIARWSAMLWRRLRLTRISAVITLAFIVGKNTGPGALSKLDAYRPVFSVSNYFETYSRYASQFLLYLTPEQIRPWLPWVLGGCIALALLMRHRVLLWASLFNIVAVLPIAFIVARVGFAFVVPLAGWLVYVAVLLVWLRRKITFGYLPMRVPSQVAVAAGIALFILPAYADFTWQFLRPRVHEQQDLNRRLWTSLRSTLPANIAGKKILILHDPMFLSWSPVFLVKLGYDEKNVTVETNRRLADQNKPVLREAYDYVFDYVDGQFVLAQSNQNTASR